MSLKAFHILFIVASTLLAFGFGAWALNSYSDGRQVQDLVMGVISSVAGVGLICYGVYFLKKSKNIGYL